MGNSAVFADCILQSVVRKLDVHCAAVVAAGDGDAVPSARQSSVLSGAGESHPRALPEPDVSLSTHPAPVIPVASRHDADGPMTKQRGVGAGVPPDLAIGMRSEAG